MNRRLELNQILSDILGSTDRVYFQPPENIKIQYPCIIYHVANHNTIFADDIPYNVSRRYEVTVIDKNPDSDIPMKIAQMPMTLFERHYTSDNLHHDVFNVYF